MSANVIDIGVLIARTPGVKGERPCIAGTGVTVHRVASWYKKGLSAEEIADQFDNITLAQVHAALAYYHINHEEIEGLLKEETELHDRLAQGTEEKGKVGE